MIDSTSILTKIYSKQRDNSWLLAEHNNVSDAFEIVTISYQLQLKSIYKDVSFAE